MAGAKLKGWHAERAKERRNAGLKLGNPASHGRSVVPADLPERGKSENGDTRDHVKLPLAERARKAAAEALAVPAHGGDRKSEKYQSSKNENRTLKRGTTASYSAAKLKRDHQVTINFLW